MATRMRPLVTSAVDSMGNPITVGDYVLANVRDYFSSPGAGNSGSSRKTVRATIKEFIAEGKVRLMDYEDPSDPDNQGNNDRSWVSAHHVTLIAPKDMATEYKNALEFHLEKGK